MVGEMKVREGYKRTELGVIPEDWEVITIKNCSLPNGLVRGPFGGSLKKECFVRNGYKVYAQQNAIYKNITDGNYFIDYNKFSELNRFKIHEGDYIISCSGTIGKIYEIPKNFEEGIINQALLKITINENKINKKYFYKYFEWDEFQESILENTQGGAMKNLVGMPVFRNISIALPSDEEQESIATVLSDTDNLITSLEKLISKKKKIKQGTMQQLLTGKMRLPGFSGGWEVKKIGDVCEVFKGDMITEIETISGNIPVIAGGKKPSYYHNAPNRIGKTITISASGANAGYIGFYKEPIYASDCSTISEENSVYDIEFIYFRLSFMQNKIYYMQTGGAQPHIHPKDIRPISINFPLLKEQKAIAQILLDMDSEIESLEQKLSKYKIIKQGMMQELLTGRIRLI